jgi:2',3'-cyclic-nucleotide 2'-phosphodiesterase (5'-nucleotidase family)
VITTQSGRRVLCLGYIYNFDQAANDSIVIHVQTSVKKEYFQNAMAEPAIDLVVVMNHIAPQNTGPQDLLSLLWKTIRGYKPETPIVLLSGHSHVEDFKWYDDNAFTIESGCYFQEMGRVRFDLDPSTGALNNSTFEYGWIPTNREEFYKMVNIYDPEQFVTPTGAEIKLEIAALWKELDLGASVGCSPATYDIAAGLSDPDSAYGLLLNEMVPKVLFDPNVSNNTQFFISSTGFLRYNLFAGPVNKNDIFTMCGFNDSYQYFPGMEGKVLQAVLTDLNNLPPMMLLENPRQSCAQRFNLGDQSLPYFISSDIAIQADQ